MRHLALAAASMLLCGCPNPGPTRHELPTEPAVVASSAPATPDSAAAFVWPQQARSEAELHRLGIAPEWRELRYDGMKIAAAIETWPTDGESYIDVYAYVFNQHFREWRQVFAVKLRGAGGIVLELDRERGILTVVGTANNELQGKALFTFDLAAVHDDG